MANPNRRLSEVFTETVEDRAAREQQRYEERVVQHLLTRYQFPSHVKHELLQEHFLLTNTRRLTLAAFHERFPSFPIRLFAHRFDYITKNATVAKIFSDFARQAFTKAFALHCDEAMSAGEASDDTHMGVIFYWPYLRGHATTEGPKKKRKGPAREPGGMIGLVLHNMTPDLKVPGVRFIWISPKKRQLTLEPLNVLLKSIDRAATGSRHQLWQP